MDSRKHTVCDRRRLLRTGGAALAAASVGSPLVTGPVTAQARTVFVNTWGGSWTAAEEAAFFKLYLRRSTQQHAGGLAMGMLRYVLLVASLVAAAVLFYAIAGRNDDSRHM